MSEAPGQAPVPPALQTRFTQLTGVRYPIVQTGMGWVSGARLTAATAAAGGLGIIASSTMSIPELETAIRTVKERTDRPFGVNIRSDGHDVGDRVDLMIREGVKVASFALAPKKELIAKLKDAGLVTMPSIGAKRHAEKVAVVAINVNRVPEDSPAKMKERAESQKFPYAYLFDETQQIARDYGASGTPEFFLLSPERKIVYMGAMDDSTDPKKAKTNYLEAAVEAALAGKAPEKTETFANGCRIRYDRRRRSS
jgi:IMP dehydrogenase/GMP reductase